MRSSGVASRMRRILRVWWRYEDRPLRWRRWVVLISGLVVLPASVGKEPVPSADSAAGSSCSSSVGSRRSTRLRGVVG